MKTTLEIRDAIFRRAKSAAAERGIPFRALVSEALADKLRAQSDRDGKPWMRTFGKLRHLHKKIAVPVIVLGEYQYGIRHSRDRERYEQWLAESILNCRVLDVDQETAVTYGTLGSKLKRARTPIPSNDVWIAALCRQHSFPLLSRDRHLDSVRGLHRIDR